MYGLRYRGSLDATTQAELEGLVAAFQEFLLREHNEDGTHLAASAEIAVVPVGGIIQWALSAIPERWLLCNGQAVSRVTYNPLFKTIGIQYGAGDGVLTFNVPDLSGRFPRGNSGTLGSTGGSSSHTHTITAALDHTHTLSALETAATATTAGIEADVNYDGATEEFTVGGHAHFTTTNTETSDAGGAHNHGGVTGSTSTLPPYVNVNFIIFAGG